MYIKNPSQQSVDNPLLEVGTIPVNSRDFVNLMDAIDKLTTFVKIHQERIAELERKLNEDNA